METNRTHVDHFSAYSETDQDLMRSLYSAPSLQSDEISPLIDIHELATEKLTQDQIELATQFLLKRKFLNNKLYENEKKTLIKEVVAEQRPFYFPINKIISLAGFSSFAGRGRH